jgi:ankyrin repeat protein
MDHFIAAELGNLKALQRLLTPDNVDDVDLLGLTALHLAAWDGHLECVKWCVKMGANVNAEDNVEWKPLHIASLHGHIEVVCVLLDAGAIVDATDKIGWTPLHRAIYVERLNVVQVLIDRGAQVSNVLLDTQVPAIADWVHSFVASRLNCRYAAVIIIGVHKYHRTRLTRNNDNNVMKLIGKHIWSMRLGDD